MNARTAWAAGSSGSSISRPTPAPGYRADGTVPDLPSRTQASNTGSVRSSSHGRVVVPAPRTASFSRDPLPENENKSLFLSGSVAEVAKRSFRGEGSECERPSTTVGGKKGSGGGLNSHHDSAPGQKIPLRPSTQGSMRSKTGGAAIHSKPGDTRRAVDDKSYMAALKSDILQIQKRIESVRENGLLRPMDKPMQRAKSVIGGNGLGSSHLLTRSTSSTEMRGGIVTGDNSAQSQFRELEAQLKGFEYSEDRSSVQGAKIGLLDLLSDKMRELELEVLSITADSRSDSIPRSSLSRLPSFLGLIDKVGALWEQALAAGERSDKESAGGTDSESEGGGAGLKKPVNRLLSKETQTVVPYPASPGVSVQKGEPHLSSTGGPSTAILQKNITDLSTQNVQLKKRLEQSEKAKTLAEGSARAAEEKLAAAGKITEKVVYKSTTCAKCTSLTASLTKKEGEVVELQKELAGEKKSKSALTVRVCDLEAKLKEKDKEKLSKAHTSTVAQVNASAAEAVSIQKLEQANTDQAALLDAAQKEIKKLQRELLDALEARRVFEEKSESASNSNAGATILLKQKENHLALLRRALSEVQSQVAGLKQEQRLLKEKMLKESRNTLGVLVTEATVVVSAAGRVYAEQCESRNEINRLNSVIASMKTAHTQALELAKSASADAVDPQVYRALRQEVAKFSYELEKENEARIAAEDSLLASTSKYAEYENQIRQLKQMLGESRQALVNERAQSDALQEAIDSSARMRTSLSRLNSAGGDSAQLRDRVKILTENCGFLEKDIAFKDKQIAQMKAELSLARKKGGVGGVGGASMGRPSTSAGNIAARNEMDDSIEAALREEMRHMKEVFEAKLAAASASETAAVKRAQQVGSELEDIQEKHAAQLALLNQTFRSERKGLESRIRQLQLKIGNQSFEVPSSEQR